MPSKKVSKSVTVEEVKPPKETPPENAITSMPPKGMIDRAAKWSGVRIPGGQKLIQMSVDYRWGSVVRDPDTALKFDNEIYDRIELFTDASSAMDYLRMTVAGNGQTFTTKNRKYDELIPYFEAFLDNIDAWHEAKQLLCYAIFRGTHAARIVSEVRHDHALIDDDQERSWWLISSLQDRDKRGMLIEHIKKDDKKDDSSNNRIYYWIFQDPVTLNWEAKDPNKYIIWEFNKTFRSNAYGEGLVAKIWPEVYRGSQLTDIYDNSFDLYGTGIKVGKIDSSLGFGQDAEPNSTTPEQRKNELYDVLAHLQRTNYTVVIDSADDVDFIWPEPGMFEILQSELKRIRSKLWMGIVGMDIHQQSGSGGNRAQASTQLRAGDRNVISLRTSLDDVINKQMFQKLWELNKVNWEEMGLWTPRCPIHYKTNRFLDRELDEEIAAAKLITEDMGGALYQKEVYERIGYTKPEITKDNIDELFFSPVRGAGMKDTVKSVSKIDKIQGNETDLTGIDTKVLDTESDQTDKEASKAQDTEAPSKEQ